jgi:hypothetical protein
MLYALVVIVTLLPPPDTVAGSQVSDWPVVVSVTV